MTFERIDEYYKPLNIRTEIEKKQMEAGHFIQLGLGDTRPDIVKFIKALLFLEPTGVFHIGIGDPIYLS